MSTALATADKRRTTLSNGRPAPPARAAARRRRRGWGPTVFAVPALLWYGVFMAGPVVAMFVISLNKWASLISPHEFTGTDNYRRVFDDPAFYDALRNTGVQLGVALPLMIPLAFMLGYYLQLRPPGHRVLRVLCFTPGLLSLSAKAMIFMGMLAPEGGVNGLLRTAGLGSAATPWLADPSTALAAVILVDVWAGIGYTAVLFAARLASVPDGVYEAAALDGAGHWRRMWQVAFPVCKGFVGVATMLQFLWTLFNSSATVLMLTKGGPGTSSTTLSYLMYQRAFLQQDVGYSQAVGVLLFVLGLAGMVVIRRVLRQNY
ncbi:sugar ABC transporter permease [Streptomyces armeniacus]|uniref:Sugar ABC transporter permease n=1 Tax=Streptomyces armeniacus TaxID=83291 RepID=A0A345XPK1_9ACTN|nr:sugar ABC transporter permease [Streptomyces armeniacus]AXK33567.1 sugar ABC transporter permease [Streptomyces armeniacus]